MDGGDDIQEFPREEQHIPQCCSVSPSEKSTFTHENQGAKCPESAITETPDMAWDGVNCRNGAMTLGHSGYSRCPLKRPVAEPELQGMTG